MGGPTIAFRCCGYSPSRGLLLDNPICPKDGYVALRSPLLLKLVCKFQLRCERDILRFLNSKTQRWQSFIKKLTRNPSAYLMQNQPHLVTVVLSEDCFRMFMSTIRLRCDLTYHSNKLETSQQVHRRPFLRCHAARSLVGIHTLYPVS